MTDKEYILELEKRIIKLEEKINNICIKEDGNVQFQTSQIATVILGENCKMEFTNCPVGIVCNNIEDAEERLEDSCADRTEHERSANFGCYKRCI